MECTLCKPQYTSKSETAFNIRLIMLQPNDVKGFFGTLIRLVKYIPKHECIIGGDMNAKIGKEDAKEST